MRHIADGSDLTVGSMNCCGPWPCRPGWRWTTQRWSCWRPIHHRKADVKIAHQLDRWQRGWRPQPAMSPTRASTRLPHRYASGAPSRQAAYCRATLWFLQASSSKRVAASAVSPAVPRDLWTSSALASTVCAAAWWPARINARPWRS